MTYCRLRLRVITTYLNAFCSVRDLGFKPQRQGLQQVVNVQEGWCGQLYHRSQS